MKRMFSTPLLAAALALALASGARAACDGQAAASIICATPSGGAGIAKLRAMVTGDLPSGIDAAKIGGGSVSTSEYDLLNGITSYGQTLISLADETALEALPDTLPNLVSVQGLTVTLTDTGSDHAWGWDDSANAYEPLTAAELVAIILSADGSGSGLDADLLDGSSSAAFHLLASNSVTFGNGSFTTLTIDAGATDPVLTFGSNSLTVSGAATVSFGTSAAFTTGTIELGAASDTTLARTGAGAISVEGVGVALNSTSLTHTASTIELGAASDTTLARTGAGAISVEGVGVALNSTSLTHTASTYEIGAASDTTLARVSAGVASIEGSSILTAATGQPLDSDLTTIAGLTATTDNILQSVASAWASRTPAQLTATLPGCVGDAGSGGTKGLVPAPVTGDASKFLRGDCTFVAIPGGGDALVANPLSQFAATTSAQLAGVISDETGSGAAVFGTAPQISTIELGAASDTTIARASAGNLTVEGNALYRAGGTDVALADGGTGASLVDPNADRIAFWDDSAGAIDWLTAAAPLTITTTTIDCDAATTSADGCSELATSAETETGTDTGRTVTPAGLLAAISGKHTIAMPAKAWTAETTTGCAAGTAELGNGIMQSSYDCDGAGSLQEGIQFTIPIMPKSWDESTITVQISWTNASGTGDVIWLVSCAAMSNDDVMNASFGTEVSVTDSVTAAADLMIAPVSGAVTCSGTPAEGDMIVIRIQRDGDNASDTLNSVDARFLGADLFYGINAFTDD